MPFPDSFSAQVFFEQYPEAALLIDGTGNIRGANARVGELLGLTAPPAVGTSLLEFVLPDQVPVARQCLHRALQGEELKHEVELRTAAGQPVQVACTMYPLYAAGAIEGVQLILQDVARTRRRTLALRQSEQQLSVIFNSLADVVFVLEVEGPARYRFVFANEAFSTITGIALENVLGHLVEDVIPADSLPLVLRQYNEACRTGQRITWQETTDYPKGRLIGEVSVAPVLNEAGNCLQLVGIVHDITEQMSNAAALAISNERYKYAIRATTDAIYDWNIPGNALYWGEGFQALFGHVLSENQSNLDLWAKLIHPDDAKATVDSLMKAVESPDTRYWQSEYRFRRADDTWATVCDRGYVLRDAQSQAVRMIGAMQDVSGRKNAEARQQKMAQELFQQNADLQQFAYIVSHNLRGPLANALGFANLLQRTDRASDVFDTSLGNLHTSLRQLDMVLQDVNKVLSVRDQRNAQRHESVNLHIVCNQVIQSLGEILQECGGTIRQHLPADLMVTGNRAYFHSLFYNLFSNAIKYRSEDRPLVVQVLDQSQPGQGATLVVVDNGSGFDSAQAGDEVFQLYKRFHATKRGRGIGLFLVKSHIESMGGTVKVESVVNVGTQFILHFR